MATYGLEYVYSIVSENLCLFIICNIIVGKYYVGKNMIVIINF